MNNPENTMFILVFMFIALVGISLFSVQRSQAQGTIPQGSPVVYLPAISSIIPTAIPTSAPRPLRFPVASVARCDPQPKGNWFEGIVNIDHQPANGFLVVFSDAPDDLPYTSAVVSGPHCGYTGWPNGYYSHIVHASRPEAGDWYVWIVDDNKQRISEIAHWHSTGPGNGCNQAIVNFDTN